MKTGKLSTLLSAALILGSFVPSARAEKVGNGTQDLAVQRFLAAPTGLTPQAKIFSLWQQAEGSVPLSSPGQKLSQKIWSGVALNASSDPKLQMTNAVAYFHTSPALLVGPVTVREQKDFGAFVISSVGYTGEFNPYDYEKYQQRYFGQYSNQVYYFEAGVLEAWPLSAAAENTRRNTATHRIVKYDSDGFVRDAGAFSQDIEPIRLGEGSAVISSIFSRVAQFNTEGPAANLFNFSEMEVRQISPGFLAGIVRGIPNPNGQGMICPFSKVKDLEEELRQVLRKEDPAFYAEQGSRSDLHAKQKSLPLPPKSIPNWKVYGNDPKFGIDGVCSVVLLEQQKE